MQIPASDRQEVMKGVPLRTLLSELEKRRFTGYCAMPIAGAGALLVMEEGRYILAEYRGIRGRDALESIRLIGNPDVDVVIAPSSKAQVAGMMKTNEPFLVDPPRQPGSGGTPASPSTTIIRPVSIGGGPGKPVRVIAVQTGKREEKAEPVPHRGRREKVPAGRAAPGQAGQPERSLDRKGLEHIKSLRDSFKTDAAELLSELNLGHLVASRPKSDKGNEGEKEEKSGTE
jgi:hypothetical protein